MCDICFQIFAENSPRVEYHFQLKRCILCAEELLLHARLVPPTCGMRVPSMDRGGIKRVLTIAFVQRLQQAMDAAYVI